MKVDIAHFYKGVNYFNLEIFLIEITEKNWTEYFQIHFAYINIDFREFDPELGSIKVKAYHQYKELLY